MSVTIIRRFPLDVRMTAWRVGARVTAGYWYPSTALQATVYWGGHAHFEIRCGVGLSVSLWWERRPTVRQEVP